ncbi:effector-associated constant component EACC1 [Streptomyces klenkii]
MTTEVEVVIRAETSRFAPDDQPWRDQVAALHTMLREEAGSIVLRGAPGPDHKGAVEATVLAVGSSGALTAAVACFRAWLARDKTRTLTVTWTDGSGVEQSIQVIGDNIDQASFLALTEGLGSRLGDG